MFCLDSQLIRGALISPFKPRFLSLESNCFGLLRWALASTFFGLESQLFLPALISFFYPELFAWKAS
jgi:hypothetical protein